MTMTMKTQLLFLLFWMVSARSLVELESLLESWQQTILLATEHADLRRLQAGMNNSSDRNETEYLEPNVTLGNTTAAPTAAPYVSDYTCLPRDGGEYFLCILPRPDYFDEAFPPNTFAVYTCSADLGTQQLEGAKLQDYCTYTSLSTVATCFILVGDSLCSGCSILPDGSMAYNCDNLLEGQSSCSNRNDLGQCNQGHRPWLCQDNPHADQNRGSFLCNEYSLTDERTLLPAEEYLPLLPANVSSTLTLLLYCDAPVYGRYTLGQCGTRCQLGSLLEGPYPCDICRLVPEKLQDIDRTLAQGNNVLAYDCSFGYPGASCASTDVNGECFDVLQKRKDRLYRCNYLNSPQDDGKNEGPWWRKSRVLTFVEARTFNIVSDLVATATRALAGLCIALAYPLVMSWHLQRPNSRGTPLSALDALNGGLLSSAHVAFILAKRAMPTVVLFLALLLAEVFHPLADVGFEPVTEPFKAGNAPVLSVHTEHRNQYRPMDLMGDPPGLRFVVLMEAIDPSGRVPILPIEVNSPVVNNFMEAVRLVATGGSPFTTDFDGSSLPSSFGGIANFTTRVGIPCAAKPGSQSPPLPLASVPLEIPLSCAQGVDSMTQVPQILTGDSLYDDPIRHVARVPNCTLTGERDTGIYPGSSTPAETADIMEFSYSDFFAAQPDQPLTTLPIYLMVNDSLTKSLMVTPEDKRLARDRQDWRQGRRVQGIQGVQVGNETLGFSTVIMASGPPAPVLRSFASPGSSLVDTVQVRFFARLNETCPDRPSGYPLTSNMTCFVFLEMECEPFREDSDIYLEHVSGAPSRCNMKAFRIVWGRNFVVDDQLLATLAGIYGVVRPDRLGYTVSAFNIYGVLAAVFALGSLVERPSIEQKIVPRVNLVFLLAMILPLLLCLICLVLIGLLYSKRLVIPRTAYEMMVFGKENPQIKPRRSKREKFDQSTKYTLFFGPSESDNASNTLMVIKETNVSASAMLRGAIREVPVSSDEKSYSGGLVGPPQSDDEEQPSS